MKIYIVLFVTAIMLSFSAAYYMLRLQHKYLATKDEVKEINFILNSFSLNQKKEIEIDFNNLYPPHTFYQLVQSIPTIKNNKSSFTKSCEATNNVKISSTNKEEIFENFRCKRIKELPKNFFSSGPIVNTDGVSFAYLAFLSSSEPYINTDWIKSNSSFFQVAELNLLPESSLEGAFVYLAKFDKNILDNVLSNQSLILGNQYLLIKKSEDSSFYYNIFRRDSFENFLKDKNYFIKNFYQNEECYYHQGNICFEPNSQVTFKLFRISSIVILVVSTTVLVLISFVLYLRIKQQSFEDEQKKHALRVLTHELRTPITNLLLQVENINKNLSELPIERQIDFLKIESETYRLKRLAEKSTSYLQTHDRNKLFKLEKQQIKNLEELVLDAIEYYSKDEINFTNNIGKFSIHTDPYWLNIVIKNLIENAINHGESPISVSINRRNEYICIDVQDRGNCPFKSVEEIIEAAKKEIRPNQQGLGLGLSIISRIVKEMNAKLTLTNHPTTFSIIFKDQK